MQTVNPWHIGQKKRQRPLCPGTWTWSSARIFVSNFMCLSFPLQQNLPLLCHAQKPQAREFFSFFQRITVPSQNTFVTQKWHKRVTNATAPSWHAWKLSFLAVEKPHVCSGDDLCGRLGGCPWRSNYHNTERQKVFTCWGFNLLEWFLWGTGAI